MEQYGKLIIIAGAVIIIIGIIISIYGRIPLLGKLPGDIHIQREGFNLFIPITSSIIISILLSILLRFFQK